MPTTAATVLMDEGRVHFDSEISPRTSTLTGGRHNANTEATMIAVGLGGHQIQVTRVMQVLDPTRRTKSQVPGVGRTRPPDGGQSGRPGLFGREPRKEATSGGASSGARVSPRYNVVSCGGAPLGDKTSPYISVRGPDRSRTAAGMTPAWVSCTGACSRCSGSVQADPQASMVATTPPLYVSYTPTRQPQGSTRPASPLRNRMEGETGERR